MNAISFAAFLSVCILDAAAAAVVFLADGDETSSLAVLL